MEKIKKQLKDRLIGEFQLSEELIDDEEDLKDLQNTISIYLEN